jgi:hypothetical protein
MKGYEVTDPREIEVLSAVDALADHFDYDATPEPEAVRGAIEAIRSTDPAGYGALFETLDPTIVAFAFNALATMLSIEKGWTPRKTADLDR